MPLNQAKAFRTKSEALAFMLGLKAATQGNGQLEILRLDKREDSKKPWVVLLHNHNLPTGREWEMTGTDEDWTVRMSGLDITMVVPVRPEETLDLRLEQAQAELAREFESLVLKTA